MRQTAGNVVMLNLLRFREVADYSAYPDLAPPTPISGARGASHGRIAPQSPASKPLSTPTTFAPMSASA